MFSSNLSMDQAPPFSAPLRFFLTAPLFGIIACIVILLNPEAMFDFKNLTTIAVVHFFTVGYFAFVMLGALQQMLPVLAGVKIPKPKLLAGVSHILMIAGTLGLCFGLIYSPVVLKISSILLFFGFLTIFLPTLFLILKSGDYSNPTINGMRIAIFFGFATVLLGVHLGMSYATFNFSAMHQSFVDLHIAMGNFGWILLLVVSVAFQVIPMFYVTPNFTKLSMKLPLFVLVCIVFWGLLKFEVIEGRGFEILGVTFFVVAMIGFALEGYKRFSQRKRPIADTAVWYWRVALISLFFAALLMFLRTVFEINNIEYLVGIIFGYGFVLSVLNGMLYKIVPFLSWFHLSSTGRFDIPTIRDFLPEKSAKKQFYIHLGSYGLFLLAFFFHSLIIVAAVVLIVSTILFEINLIKSVKLYKETLKKPAPKEFSWN